METIENTETERVIETKPSQRWPLKIAGAAIFSGISLLFAIYATGLPRVQWGLALFDPVSIVWILSFFIFGYEAGIITSVVGMIILMPFDSFAPIGPIMKFTATIPLIIIPLLSKLIMKKPRTREVLFKNSSLAVDWVIAVIVRIVVMVIFNIIAINLMFGGDFFAATIDLTFLGLPGITGWTAIYLTVIFINLLQSIWDLLIPLVITKIVLQNNKFILW